MRIGVDLGGTRIKAGLVDRDGTVVQRAVRETGEDKSALGVVRAIASAIDPMLSEASGIGLAAAGVLECASGLIRESPNFPQWRDVPLGARLEAEVGLPVTLENDANAVIWGEATSGAARGARNLVGYTLGTGVGGAVILDGRLWRGERGMAGELGHRVVVPGGHPCGCGGRGCLEQYAGAVGLGRELELLGYPHFARGPEGIRLASEAARAGDEVLLGAFKALGEHLGIAMAGILHALDISCVVLAGGLTHSADLFHQSAYEAMVAHAFPSMAEGVSVLIGTLHEDAGIVGAASIANAPENAL